MNEIIDKTNWAEFLKSYTARNKGRPTRLGVFEETDDIMNDYWIEDGLPLVAIDAYPDNGNTNVEILFDKYTHAIDGAAKLVSIGGEGKDLGLDISDAEGKTTVLRFENWPLKNEE
jgi:hypothetical protein